MATLPDWTLVRSFLACLREGSLSGAARATRLTQPTIGRHVAELEAALGAALFTRSPSGLVPTPAAEALRGHAEAMEAALGALLRTAEASTDDTRLAGPVRIAASEIVGVEVLPPILAGLRARHPQIAFELSLSNRADDLLRRDADVAVRMFRPSQDGLVARRVGTLGLGFYAHKAYLARFGAPEGLEALPRHHLIGFDRDDRSARAVVSDKIALARESFAFRCDADLAQLAAIRAGLGIGVVQYAIAAGEPDLVPVLPGALPLVLECWVVAHEDQRERPIVRATLDALAEGLARHAAKGTGAGG